MNLFDMDGLYVGPEEEAEPGCPTCGAGLHWESCDACGGEGGEDPYEEDPTWYMGHGRAWDECDQCEGHGGWYRCFEKHEGKRCFLPSELPKED